MSDSADPTKASTASPKASGMKSAYELALERLDSQGIDRPQQESLDAATRERMAEVRRQCEAKLAELEILHRDRLRGVRDPAERQQTEQDYVLERRSLEERRDRQLDKLRHGG